MRLPSVGIGIQHIGERDLRRAASANQRVRGVWIGWTHLSRRVTPELAEKALGRIITIGGRSGFRRLRG